MSNLGKSLTKLLSPRHYSLSVSPNKNILSKHSNRPEISPFKVQETNAVQRLSEHNSNRGPTRISGVCEGSTAKKLKYDHLQVPKYEIPLVNSPLTKELLQRGVERIANQNIIGRGRFGTVIKGLYKDAPVAIKIIAKDQVKAKETHKEENAVKLVHPNIVRVLQTMSSEENFDIILMEYCSGINLLQKINDANFSMDTEGIIRYSLDVGYALQHCHKNKIIHLDVKPDNIIIDSSDHCKLCDFGSSRIMDTEKGVKGPWPGTPAYAAPEVLKGYCVSCSADIYSYGITLWQMLSREVPYFGEEIHSVIYKVVTNDHRPHKIMPENKQHLKYIRLYEECWKDDWRARPTMDEAIMSLLQI